MSDFHVRFHEPVPWARAFSGQISSEGPARCHGYAALGTDDRLLVRRRFGRRRCSRRWRRLSARFSQRQLRRVLDTAHRDHRRILLFVHLAGRVAGHEPDQHLRSFVVDLPPRNAAPAR